MGFIIRQMEKKDIKQIQDVATQSWNSTYDGIIPPNIQENFLRVAYSDEMLQKRLKESFIFVAIIENEVVGFADFSPVNTQGQSELSAIYLYSNCQGKGIGTGLLQKGIQKLEGAKEVYVDVEKENSIGRSFYERKGFKTIKEYEDNFDGHILKSIQMCLTI